MSLTNRPASTSSHVMYSLARGFISPLNYPMAACLPSVSLSSSNCPSLAFWANMAGPHTTCTFIYRMVSQSCRPAMCPWRQASHQESFPLLYHTHTKLRLELELGFLQQEIILIFFLNIFAVCQPVFYKLMVIQRVKQEIYAECCATMVAWNSFLISTQSLYVACWLCIFYNVQFRYKPKQHFAKWS